MRNVIKIIAFAAMMSAPAFDGYGQKLMGLVYEKNAEGVDQPVPGANVYWLGTTVATVTGNNGVFMIDKVADHDSLVISFIGYTSDTVKVAEGQPVRVQLKPEYLKEVTVEGWKASTGFDHSRVVNTSIMGEKELFKAACCNLSESFETNPSVDVAFTDALTGTRQIQMLGLAGPNTLISVENMPGVRGLAASQGIQFIPGTWINSIEVTKGVGPVVNGYESIAGQINVELKKPEESEKLYLNGYLNQSARSELNLNYTAMAGKKWATTLLLHGSARPLEMDGNNDGFLDFPTGSQINAINRWVFNSGKGVLGQFGVKVLRDSKQGGEKGFDPETDQFTTNRYGLEINTDRVEVWGKLGYQFQGKPYQSIGLQLSGVRHEHDSYYGFTTHDGNEQSFYSNLIFQSILGTTMHKYKAGISFLYDRYDERLATGLNPIQVMDGDVEANFNELSFQREERVPGAFLEYTFDYLDKVSVVAGARVDYHNLFGTIFTPRIHTRFNVTPVTSLRLAAGKGTRIANVIAENTGVLASSRQIVFSNRNATYGYGFKPDEAWNYGVNLSHDFTLNYRSGSITADYFYTDFKNQTIVDYDKSAREVNFLALDGKSYSHSAQFQVDYEVARRFDVRAAYRWLNVKTDYIDGLLSKPLVPQHRWFLNLAYETKNHWTFDYTVQWIGRQRIPDTSENPIAQQLDAYSPAYLLMNAQVTKDLAKRWSFYLGVENITNYQLDDPIIDATYPFGPYFDSSLVWGPIFGRMTYVGFRYRVK